jgi:hypothetical protein
VDWGIGWQSDIAPHKHSTSVHLVMGYEQLESSEHSDFQRQESGNCWGTESHDATGWTILIQLLVALAETTAQQDRTQVQLNT